MAEKIFSWSLVCNGGLTIRYSSGKSSRITAETESEKWRCSPVWIRWSLVSITWRIRQRCSSSASTFFVVATAESADLRDFYGRCIVWSLLRACRFLWDRWLYRRYHTDFHCNSGSLFHRYRLGKRGRFHRNGSVYACLYCIILQNHLFLCMKQKLSRVKSR